MSRVLRIAFAICGITLASSARFAEAGSGFLGDLLAAVPSSNYSGNTNSPWVIQAYDANGNSVGPFTTINFPTGATTTTVGAMALAPDGNVYVGEYYGVNNGGPGNAVGLVQEFNGTTGAFIKTIVPGGSGGLGAPTGLAFDGQGTIYALDRNPTNGTTGAINEYSASTGTFLRQIAFPANNIFSWSPAFGMVYADGKLFVAGGSFTTSLQFQASVEVLSATTGQLLTTIVLPPGKNYAQSITLGPDGMVYVDSVGAPIYKISPSTYGFTDFSAGIPPFGYNASLSFGANGNLFVAQYAGTGIFEFNGQTGAQVGSGAFVAVSPGFNINPILGDFSLNAVPEPSSLVLAVLGFVGVAARLFVAPASLR